MRVTSFVHVHQRRYCGWFVLTCGEDGERGGEGEKSRTRNSDGPCWLLSIKSSVPPTATSQIAKSCSFRMSFRTQQTSPISRSRPRPPAASVPRGTSALAAHRRVQPPQIRPTNLDVPLDASPRLIATCATISSRVPCGISSSVRAAERSTGSTKLSLWPPPEPPDTPPMALSPPPNSLSSRLDFP